MCGEASYSQMHFWRYSPHGLHPAFIHICVCTMLPRHARRRSVPGHGAPAPGTTWPPPTSCSSWHGRTAGALPQLHSYTLHPSVVFMLILK